MCYAESDRKNGSIRTIKSKKQTRQAKVNSESDFVKQQMGLSYMWIFLGVAHIRMNLIYPCTTSGVGVKKYGNIKIKNILKNSNNNHRINLTSNLTVTIYFLLLKVDCKSSY